MFRKDDKISAAEAGGNTMSHATKYTLDERNIARKIHDFQRYRYNAYKRWHFYDMKIGVLIKELKGKYKPRH